MTRKDEVFCGINARLSFDSVYQRFGCPLSTTTELSIAQQFATNSESVNKGIILKLKRANAKTRYFDVEPFTNFENEKEWLIMGSTLKIIDIYLFVDGKLKSYTTTMAALLMFEQMINGRHVDGNKKARGALRKLLQRASMNSIIDTMRTSNDSDQQRLCISLRDDGYDTDAVLIDTEDVQTSNITKFVSDERASDKITKSIQETCSMLD